MSRVTFSPALRASLLFLCAAIGLQAQIVTYTWTGAAGYSYWTEPANWLGNSVPVADVANTRILFGNTRGAHIDYSEIYVNQLSFQGITQPFELHGGWDTTHIGSGGIIYNPAQPVRSFIMDAVQLEASQTWDIKSGQFIVEGPISDYTEGSNDYSITKTGAGTLVLENNSSYSWSGGLILSQGQVVINPAYDTANYNNLGTGTLTFNGGTLVASEDSHYGDPVYIENNVVSNGLISTKNETELHVGYSGEGYSTIELTANTTIQSNGKPLFLEGNIIQTGGEAGTPRSLNVTGSGAVILTGNNSYTGGTTVTNGVLIFGNAYAIPSNNLDSNSVGHLTAGTNGYIGFGDNSYTNSVQSYFLNDFNKAATIGTIGLDTDPELSTPNIFTANIDLSAVPTGTAFGPTARLGSATTAILTGTITPQGSDYRFGGGGGNLEVQSALTDAAGPVVRNVVLDSPAELPLTVRFTSTGNTLTGGVSATHSAAIFGSGALPATGTLTLGTGGYIGVNDLAQTSGLSQAFINRFATTTDRGMIGFDAASEHVTISDNVSLAGFTDASPGIYLGTASRATITGTITPQGSIYRFGAYKGGFLTVSSTLVGAGNSVHIGDPNSLGTMGDFQQEEYSTVRLDGNNTYGGTTTLYTGRLELGHANALGTGALIVQPHSLSLPTGEEDVWPELRVDSGLIIANAIDLNADLNIGGSSTTFTLSGPVSGPGELYLDGDYNHLTLSGNNSAFSGGIYLSGYNSALTLGSNNAAGTGPLGFGYTSSATVYFDTSAPVIGGLASKEQYDYAAFYAQQADTILTINQGFDSGFNGEIRSNHVNDSVRFVKNGANTLWLKSGGLYYHNGVVNADLAGAEIGLQVNQGTLVLGNGFYIEDSTPTVWIHGGTLALDNANIYNPLVIDNGGRLTGNGHLNMATIGTGATISPGMGNGTQIGFLEFNNHLTLAAGGTYEWNLAHNGEFVSDHVNVGNVTTLEITATSTDKFTLRAITLGTDGNPGILAGAIGPNTTYSWMLISALSITPNGAGFDPNAFTLDVSQFQTDVGTGLALGTFSVSLANEDTQLMLNLTTFAGIPEPSTYALLALGLGLLGLTAWRQRRAS